MWSGILDRLLKHMMRKGVLKVTYPDGTTRSYGNGRDAPEVAVTLLDESLLRRIVLSPDLGAGEGYMDGTLTIENDDIYGFLTLAVINISANGQPWFRKPLDLGRHMMRRLHQFNPGRRARANVAHHYDLSGELYDLFLDSDRQYSCGYFPNPDMTLEEAQEAKKAHIAKKLLIEPGMRVLDIGCGWGGMGLALARDFGAEVMGVTLSREQHAMANERAEKAGLADKARFELMDYRDVTGKFDRVVSIGMFEHVGVPHYHAYFSHLRDCLTEDGVALVHTIGRAYPPGFTNPWINKYIFPGGYVPALSETMKAVEKNHLFACDIEVWRHHYARTLHIWYERFMANIDKIRALYDDRFCRMWRYYLVASEVTFLHSWQVVFQLQLSPKQTAVPLTRDYMCPDGKTKS